VRNVPQAAKELGISVPKMWKIIYAGDIPFVRIGRSVRVREEDIQTFIKQNLTQYGAEVVR
jgi:excisionase family DNA binding protein